MKKLSFTFVLFHAAMSYCVGQNTDSLQSILDDTRDRTIILSTLDALGKESLQKNPQKAIEYYQEYFQKAKDDVAKQAYAMNQIGVAWYYAGDFKQSTEHYFQALHILADVQDHELLARIYNNIGWNFREEENLEPAIDYFKKAEAHAKKLTDQSFVSLILNNLGVTYKNKRDYGNALKMYAAALAINTEINDVSGQIFNLNNMSIIYYRVNDYDKSIEYLEQVRPLIAQTHDTITLVNYLLNYGNILLKLKSPQQALDTANLGLTLATTSNFIRQRMELEFLSYEAYKELTHYKNALEHFEKYIILKDSIYRTGQTEFIQELNAKYNLAQKEKDLQIAQNKNLEQRLYLTIISGGLALTLLAFILMLRNYRLKRKKNQELNRLNNELKKSYLTIKDQNEEIQVQSEELREAYEEIQVINENLESTVTERTQKLKIQNEKLIKYARMNAHDVRGPLARILGLIQLLDFSKREEKEEYISRIKESAKELDQVIHEMNKTLEDEDF